MKDMVYAVLALICAIGTAVCFYLYISHPNAESANMLYFVGAIILLVITLITGALFLSGRVNKSEDIHITE
ncbi:MAG: hypothetical protein ACK5NT_05570 [Pyrinomonadaceae bacterium]